MPKSARTPNHQIAGMLRHHLGPTRDSRTPQNEYRYAKLKPPVTDALRPKTLTFSHPTCTLSAVVAELPSSATEFPKKGFRLSCKSFMHHVHRFLQERNRARIFSHCAGCRSLVFGRSSRRLSGRFFPFCSPRFHIKLPFLIFGYWAS